jgi:hypothetical protein
MQTLIREFVRPMFKPALWIASFALRKTMAGDLNAGVRPLAIMAQTQATHEEARSEAQQQTV